jgi:hypothetical protein
MTFLVSMSGKGDGTIKASAEAIVWCDIYSTPPAQDEHEACHPLPGG